MPDTIDKIFFVSDGERQDINNTYIRRSFILLNKYAKNKLDPAIPENIGGAEFYNLSNIPTTPCTKASLLKKETTTQCIAARRMRPLLRDSQFNFFINGHYHFS